MSRFLLSLREIHLSETYILTSQVAQFTSGVRSLRLSSAFLGNIAAPLSMSPSTPSERSPEYWGEPLMAGLGGINQATISDLELENIGLNRSDP